MINDALSSQCLWYQDRNAEEVRLNTQTVQNNSNTDKKGEITV